MGNHKVNRGQMGTQRKAGRLQSKDACDVFNRAALRGHHR